MERIAKFHKVSYEQFEGDWKDTFGPIETEEILTDAVELPGLVEPQFHETVHLEIE